MGCDRCGAVHLPLKFKHGDLVRALSMMPHILRDNPFGDIKPDRTGDIGVVVTAVHWDSTQSSAYQVNFNRDPNGPWYVAPFNECQLEAAAC